MRFWKYSLTRRAKSAVPNRRESVLKNTTNQCQGKWFPQTCRQSDVQSHPNRIPDVQPRRKPTIVFLFYFLWGGTVVHLNSDIRTQRCNVIPPPGTTNGMFAGASVPTTTTPLTKMTEYTLPEDCIALARSMLAAVMANISPAVSTYDGKKAWEAAYFGSFDLECALGFTALVSPPLSPFPPPSNAHTSDRFRRSCHSCNRFIIPSMRSGTPERHHLLGRSIHTATLTQLSPNTLSSTCTD